MELSKCFWVPITWKWKQGIPSLVVKQSRLKGVIIKESESKEYLTIPRKSGKDTEKRLGVWNSCDGVWHVESANWNEYSASFGKKVRLAGLGRKAGRLAYHSMWLAKFRFSAPVIGFTVTQVGKVQKAILSPCLAAAGYCSKMPHAVVHGPEKWGGMDWDHCGIMLLYEKLKLLIGSIRLQDKVGSILVLQLSWLQLFAGSSTPILQSSIVIPYLPRGWVATVHHHLVHYGVQVEISGV